MKNLILIILLSFIVFGCSKDNTEPQEEDNRIKNDIPSELLGKWKEVATRDYHMWDDDDNGVWYASDTGKDYDYHFKEYSICCEDFIVRGQDCDYQSYLAYKDDNLIFFTHRFFIATCGGEFSNEYKKSFLITKGNELIINYNGIDDSQHIKYIKVE